MFYPETSRGSTTTFTATVSRSTPTTSTRV